MDHPHPPVLVAEVISRIWLTVIPRPWSVAAMYGGPQRGPEPSRCLFVARLVGQSDGRSIERRMPWPARPALPRRAADATAHRTSAGDDSSTVECTGIRVNRGSVDYQSAGIPAGGSRSLVVRQADRADRQAGALRERLEG